MLTIDSPNEKPTLEKYLQGKRVILAEKADLCNEVNQNATNRPQLFWSGRYAIHAEAMMQAIFATVMTIIRRFGD